MIKGSRDSSDLVGIEDTNKISGLPKQCWCGEKILLKTSKSDNNPNRRYFRCALAAFNQLQRDKHLFKGLDDAMLSENDVLNAKIETLEDIVKEITIEKKEMEKLFDRFEVSTLQNIDNVIEESKRKLKLAMIASFGGFSSLFLCRQ